MAATIPVWLGNAYLWLYAGQQHNSKGCLYFSEAQQHGATNLETVRAGSARLNHFRSAAARADNAWHRLAQHIVQSD